MIFFSSFKFYVLGLQVGFRVELLEVPYARIMEDRYDVPRAVLPTMLYGSDQVQSRRSSYKNALILYQVVRHVQRLLVTHLLGVIDDGLVEVRSGSVQSDSFNDRIKRILEAEAFLFLQSKQDIVLHLVEKARALRIGKDYLDVFVLALQVLRDSGYCSACAS